MSDATVTLTLADTKDGWERWLVTSIGVNVERGGKGEKTIGWVTLSQPVDRALPVARQISGDAPQPEDTLPFDEIKNVIAALLDQVDGALTKDAW